MNIETKLAEESPGAELTAAETGRPRASWGRFRVRAGEVLRAWAGLFPLTLSGVILLALMVGALAYMGLRRGDLVALAAASMASVVALLMALAVFAAALLARVALRGREAACGLLLECGSPQDTGFSPPWPARLPLLELEWAWESPAGSEVVPERRWGSLAETVVLHRRGDHPEILRRYSVRDVLGLASVTWREREERAICSLPHRGKLDTLTLLDGLAGGDDLSDPRGEPVGDRVDMRQYSQGDSPRMILWKVYARTRKLLVRVPERAVAARPRSCAYLVAGRGDEASAGLMRVVLERGFLGENWRFGADGSPGFAGALNEALDLLVHSGNADPEGPTGLREFLGRAQHDGFSACFLAVPPRDGPWVDPVLEALGATGLRVHIHTAVDGTGTTGGEEPLWKRLLLRSGSEGGDGAGGDLRGLARKLHVARWPCLVVSRTGGRVLGELGQLHAERGMRP